MIIIIYGLYIMGIVAVAQGVGGLINKLTQADGPSWFFQLHLISSEQPGLQIVASIIIMIIGLVLFLAATKLAKKSGVSLD